MKLTKSKLKQIVKEELLKEMTPAQIRQLDAELAAEAEEEDPGEFEDPGMFPSLGPPEEGSREYELKKKLKQRTQRKKRKNEEFGQIDEATTLATRLEFKVKIMPDEGSYKAKCRGVEKPCGLNGRQVQQSTKELQLFLEGFKFDGFPGNAEAYLDYTD